MKNQPKAFLFGSCLTIAGMLLSPSNSLAQIIHLADNGSSADVNFGSSAGMYDWLVGTGNVMQNELNQQWFWYSVNGGPVKSIDQLGGYNLVSQSSSSVEATYNNAQLTIDIQYSLTGGGVNSGSADITESVTVFNNSASLFNVSLFEYSNFNLLQNNANTVQIFGDSVNGYTSAYQNAGTTALSEGIVSPFANSSEAGLAGPTLTDVEAGTLNDNLLAGPGNVAWAFGWNSAVAANGGEFDVLKDKELMVQSVPEPTSIALISLGLGAAGFLRRRKVS